MPAATPQEAQQKWEANTASGVTKYRAKLVQMHANFATGLQRFWGVAAGPATTGAYTARVNESAAARLGSNTQGKGSKWLANAQAGVQR